MASAPSQDQPPSGSIRPIARFNVLGVGVSALSLGEAAALLAAVRHGTPRGYVCLGTVHGVSEARADPAYRRLLNRSWITSPDGMPLVWLGKRAGHAGITRVYGPDLLLAVAQAGLPGGLRHYFLGGQGGVAQTLAARLTERFPGLAVAGTYTPPFRPLEASEEQALRADIARTRADIVWVGLGTPKQERFMAAHPDCLGAGALVGIGAAFDFHSGRIRQAPPWIRRSGLEWLFRLSQEPFRLGPRYFKTNPVFVLRLLAQAARLRRYPLD